MNKSYYDIIYTYQKKMFLGVLDESLKTIINFEEIVYSDTYDELEPHQCSIVVINEEDNKRKVIPLQSVSLQDDEGKPVIMGTLDPENILASANNVFKDIPNIIKFH